MKRSYKRFEILGTLGCVSALVVLLGAVLTVDWVSIQEPRIDQLELDKLGPYEEPKPHLIRAKFGLFKMCIKEVTARESEQELPNNNARKGGLDRDCQWYNYGLMNIETFHKLPSMPTELIAKCVEKLRFTLPFIAFSVIFTSISFFCITFGHFCPKNKKIFEASMLILGGLCQATALLTFVVQIGSEFEASLTFSRHQSQLIMFYRYKYGYSFYLFLLSFGLSELGAFFDLLAYFRKYPPSQYVITFHRQEPSTYQGGTSTLPLNQGRGVSGDATLQRPSAQEYPLLPMDYRHQHAEFIKQGGPDLCSDFSTTERMEFTLSRRVGGEEKGIPPQSYINPEVTITTIESGTVGTIKNTRSPNALTMQSFGTLRKENNV